MKRDEIMGCFKTLGLSHGLYGRIYNNLMQMQQNDPEGYDKTMVMFESKDFKDMIDLIMFIEG